MGPLGLYGHESSIGFGVYDRLPENLEHIPGMLSENICYGTSNPLEAIVLMILLYSDQEVLGSKNSLTTTVRLTGALENFLDPNHHLFGIAMGKHTIKDHMCVVCMCLEFLSEEQVQYWKD